MFDYAISFKNIFKKYCCPLPVTNDGYVKGFAIGSFGVKNIEQPYLTTKGYEYLTDNTMMKKAYKFLKEIKGWIPTMN